jgi:FkbM family methyltransferase
MNFWKMALGLCFLITVKYLVAEVSPSAEKVFVANFVHEGDLVFDIGAHVGKKTDIYRACGAHVICVEPQPGCVALLRNKYHKDDHVEIVDKGLAAQPGSMTMYICSKATTISTFSRDWTENSKFQKLGYTWDRTVTVDVITLDQLIDFFGEPKFCKIDVENYEYEVLSGLSRRIPLLSFEFHEEYFKNVDKCLKYLVKLGYKKFNVAIGENSFLALEQWVVADELLTLLRGNCFKLAGGLWGDVYACA